MRPPLSSFWLTKEDSQATPLYPTLLSVHNDTPPRVSLHPSPCLCAHQQSPSCLFHPTSPHPTSPHPTPTPPAGVHPGIEYKTPCTQQSLTAPVM